MKIKKLLNQLSILFVVLTISVALIFTGRFISANPKMKAETKPAITNITPPTRGNGVRRFETDYVYPSKKIEIATKKIVALSKKADDYYKKQQFEKCLKIYIDISEIVREENLSTRMPINTRIGASYVNIAERDKNFDYAVKAEKHFKIAIRENPDDILAVFDLARAYVIMSDVTHDKKYLTDAKKYLKQAKEVANKIDPENGTNVSTMICQIKKAHPDLESSD